MPSNGCGNITNKTNRKKKMVAKFLVESRAWNVLTSLPKPSNTVNGITTIISCQTGVDIETDARLIQANNFFTGI